MPWAGNKMEKIRLGYLASLKIGEKYIGGVMITDEGTVPLEFKYTEPLQPTRLQRILFGKTMDLYLSEEVIRRNLLKEVNYPPLVYFVADIALLADAAPGKVPLAALQQTTLPALARPGEAQRVKEKEILIQSGTSSSPCRVTFFTPETDVQERILNSLASIIGRIDLLEPFQRMEAALAALCQEKN